MFPRKKTRRSFGVKINDGAILTSQRSELSSLLDETVEEAQSEEQFSPSLWLIATVEEHLIVDRIVQVRTQQIGAQAFRTLVGHLDTVLQDSDWEQIGRVGREPETEVIVHFAGHKQFLADSLQLRHPTGRQVTVLQDDPVAFFDTFDDEGLSVGTLCADDVACPK